MTYQRIDKEFYQPGDIIFCHGRSLVDWGIRVAEWLRFRRGSYYNHVAMLWRYDEELGDWMIIEAESRGVTTNTLSFRLARCTVKVYAQPAAIRSPNDPINFMLNQQGDKYGFLTLVSLIPSLILPGMISFYKPGTWICSAVVAEALRYGGWLYNWTNMYQTTPAQLYEAIQNVA